MASTFGHKVRISLFGESHGEGIGVVIDGLPPGKKISLDAIRAQMARRRPGKDRFSTPRSEADSPKILSGMLGDTTTGAPLCAVIENTNTRSQDYQQTLTLPRPSHADYAAHIKYQGFNDLRGGGHFSGRITAPLVFAGALCRQILEEEGIVIGSHVYSIGEIHDTPFDMVQVSKEQLQSLSTLRFGVIDEEAKERMLEEIKRARIDTDSVGGIVECAVCGLPAGIGSPMTEGVENVLAPLLFAIPAVKGVEFGLGFDITTLRGSQSNDPFRMVEGQVRTVTNHNGGINGGITNGMPLVFRVAVKPTSSIGQPQDTVNLSTGQNDTLLVKGRHDPCIVPRALPVVEAAAAIALMNLM